MYFIAKPLNAHHANMHYELNYCNLLLLLTLADKFGNFRLGCTETTKQFIFTFPK